jgi:MerR family transcriptional regulator/heat shock protein HspR
LAGIKRVIELTNQVEALQLRLAELSAEVEMLRAHHGDAIPKTSTALVVWQPRLPRR